MKSQKKRTRILRPPFLSIIASIVVAVCAYGAIAQIIWSVRDDVDYGLYDELAAKLSNMEFIAALGISALLLIFLAVQVGNYFMHIKPLKLFIENPDPYSKNKDAVLADFSAIRAILDECGETAKRIYELQNVITKSFRDVTINISHIATSTRQLFINAAAVDNTVVVIIKDIETYHEKTRRDILNAAKLGSSRVAAADNHPERPNEAKKALITFKKFFAEAGKFFDTLIQERSLISNRLESFSAAVDEIAADVNMLSLDAALESARAGAKGRGFARIADGIRKHADDLRDAVRNIKEAGAQMEIQAKLIDEVTSLMTSTQYDLRIETNQAAGGAADSADSINSADTAKSADAAGVEEPSAISADLDKSFLSARTEFDSMRVAIRAVGAALADASKIAETEAKRTEHLAETGKELNENVNTLIALLDKAGSRSNSIIHNISSDS